MSGGSSANNGPPRNGAQPRLAEIVLQGVRRFSDVHRFPFKPGYNVIYGLNESGKSTVFEVMRSLLFARPAEGEGESFKSWRQDAGAVCRAGLTITAGTQVFRVMKDYTTGNASLSKLDPAQKKFVLLSDSPPAIQRWLRDALRVPVGPDFGRLFTVEREDVPSMNLTAGERPNPGEDFEAHIASMTMAQKREELQNQVAEYSQRKELTRVEEEHLQVTQRLDELAQTLKRADAAEQQVKQAEAAFEPFALKPKLPDDIEEKVEDYERDSKRLDEQLMDLRPQQEMARGGLQATQTPEEWWKDPPGIAGAAAVLVGIIGAAAFSGAPQTIAGLVIFGGVGVIGWRVVHFVKSQEEHAVHKESATKANERIRALEKAFEVETAVVRSFMKQLGVDSAEDLLEHKRAREEAQAALDAARSALDQVSSGQDLDAARREREDLQKKNAVMEERLAELGGGGPGGFDVVSLSTIIARVVALETMIAESEGRRPRPPSALLYDESINDDRYASAGDPVVDAVDRYCAARQADRTKVMRVITEAFSRNVEAFTGGVWQQAIFSASGRISLRRSVAEEPVPIENLPAPEQDAVYAALRFTLLQLESKGGPPIVLLDDPFDFDEGRSKLLARALQTLGRSGQILHFTSQPTLTRFADHSVEL